MTATTIAHYPFSRADLDRTAAELERMLARAIWILDHPEETSAGACWQQDEQS